MTFTFLLPHTKDLAFEARVCVTVWVKGVTVTHWKLKENGGMFVLPLH